jgi:hypothetical protein
VYWRCRVICRLFFGCAHFLCFIIHLNYEIMSNIVMAELRRQSEEPEGLTSWGSLQ